MGAGEAASAARRGALAQWRDRAGALATDLLRSPTAARTAQRGAVAAFSVRVASAAVLYLSQIVLARLMGGFEYGIYVFVWTWVLVLGGLSNLGMSTLMIRLVPEYRERGQFDHLRGLLVTGRVLPLGASLLIAGLAGAALLWQGGLVAHHYVLPAFLALTCVPLIALSDVHDGIGRGRGWLVAALLPPYVLRPTLVLLAMAGAYAFGLPMTAVTAAGAAVAGTLVATLVQFGLIQSRLARDVPRGPSERPVRLWLATSLPLLAITFSEILLQNTDVLVVSQLMSPGDVGNYFAAAKTMSLVMFVHYAVGSAMANQFATLNARGDRDGLETAVREAVTWTFWPSLATAALLLLAGPQLLSLFGPQFGAGYPVMSILAIGYLARAAAGPSELLLNMLGKQRASAIVAITVAILTISLNLLLVPLFGLKGAALATAAAMVVGVGLNTLIARRSLGLRIGIWSHLRR